MSEAMDFYPLQKMRAKTGAISMDKSFLILWKNQQPMSLRLPQRTLPTKRQKQQAIWLDIRLQKWLQSPLQLTKIQKESAQPVEMATEICKIPEKQHQIIDDLQLL